MNSGCLCRNFSLPQNESLREWIQSCEQTTVRLGATNGCKTCDRENSFRWRSGCSHWQNCRGVYPPRPQSHWSNSPAPLPAATVTVCRLCDRRCTMYGYLRFFCSLSENSANRSMIHPCLNRLQCHADLPILSVQRTSHSALYYVRSLFLIILTRLITRSALQLVTAIVARIFIRHDRFVKYDSSSNALIGFRKVRC